MQALADFAFDTFGAVHLLCNNAGISPAGRIWDFTDDEWQTLLGVNVRGVANGIRSFVPRMIDQGEGHIVNTGSGRQLRRDAVRLGPYCATKHAIVGLSEALRYELDGTGIGVSVLVPAGVNTNIGDSMVRPSATDPDAIADDFTVLTGALDPTSLEMIEPDVVAEVTFVGVPRGLGLHRDGPGPGGRRDAPLRRGPRRAPAQQGALPLPAPEQVWKTRARGALPAVRRRPDRRPRAMLTRFEVVVAADPLRRLVAHRPTLHVQRNAGATACARRRRRGCRCRTARRGRR